MTIELSQDLEQIVRDAMQSGHYLGEQDVIREALTRLKQTMPSSGKTPVKKPKLGRNTVVERSPLSPDELDRELLAAGLILQLPNPAEDVDDDDEPPVDILGEPLSETILRERR